MRKELLVGVSAFSGLLGLATEAQAGPISGYPTATVPLAGTECAIGTQSGITVQICAQDIANLTQAPSNGNTTLTANVTVTKTLTVNGATTLGNVSIGNVTGSLAVTGNATVTGLGNCTGINTTSGLFGCQAGTWTSAAGGGNNTAPNSTGAYTMQGLAGAFTPLRSGVTEIQVCGTIVDPGGNTTQGTGILLQLSYGTGGAPANNAAVTGTQTGPIATYKNPATVTAASVAVPFCQNAVANLTVNTAYWIDEAAKAIGAASQIGISATWVTVIER